MLSDAIEVRPNNSLLFGSEIVQAHILDLAQQELPSLHLCDFIELLLAHIQAIRLVYQTYSSRVYAYLSQTSRQCADTAFPRHLT